MELKDTKDVKWTPVVGYEDRYLVSTDGQVYSIKSKKMLKPREHSAGYLKVGLCKDGVQKDHYIHRLMCQAFFGIPDDGRNTVNHLDQNKKNNVITNLQWTTNGENVSYSWGLHYDERCQQSVQNCKSRKPVVAYDKEGNYAGQWESLTAAAADLDVCLSNVSRSLNSGGYYAVKGLKFYDKE